jgi:hypothetical protein
MPDKARRPELASLVGIRIPGVYTRRFIEYLTDAQLIRLAFWLVSQKVGAVSAHRLNQIQAEVDRRGLAGPASWQKLPFDNEVQQAAWELWAALATTKEKAFPRFAKKRAPRE